MLRRTPPLSKLASTIHGQRRILKTKLPVQKYIQMAVQAGSYKSPSTRPNYLGLHDLPPPTNNRFLSKREREEQMKARRGIIDYPTEYEILSLNPPLPMPPKTPVKIRKKIAADKKRRVYKLKKELEKKRMLGLLSEDEQEGTAEKSQQSELELELNNLPSLDHLVKSYLRRHEQRQKDLSPSQIQQEEEYYSNLLLGRPSEQERDRAQSKTTAAFTSPSTLRTAMGRKSIIVENAYAFALRQQQELLQNAAVSYSSRASNTSKLMTEQESVEKVEQLLREEARQNRQKGHAVAKDIQGWREDDDANSTNADETSKTSNAKKSSSDKNSNKSSIPSILHSKPRTIRALSIWSSRLQSIPYSQWTVGAATALDHWIAREVLGMEENTWLAVLEGGGADVASLDKHDSGEYNQDGESRAGIVDRMRDIVTVRGALFPETLVSRSASSSSMGGEVATELEDDLLDEGNATSQSIDALLASLGGMDDDEEGEDGAFKFHDEEGVEKDGAKSSNADEKAFESIMDELQVWRERNTSSPYDSWDADRKNEFDQWINKYVATLSPESDAAKVDMQATREALLSERPVDKDQSKSFWNKVRTETEAELFLQDYRTKAQEQLLSSATNDDAELKSQLDAILSIPFERQLRKLVNMGTLRPILDEYTHEKDRQRFFEKYTPIFLEGLEMEHLVPDPDGPIALEDLTSEIRSELSQQWAISSGSSNDGNAGASSSTSSVTAILADASPRFSIQMIAYGTDEFGTKRAARARDMYRLWNEHKANRARFEEAMFKKGMLGLEETRKPTGGKKGGKK